MHDVQAEGASPMEQMLGHEDDALLTRCMGTLEPEPRRALLLAFYDGLTHPGSRCACSDPWEPSRPGRDAA